MGLIATNTIGQGDTRSTGLRWICTNGGTIYRATKRLKWPGEAAVVVSVVNVCKGMHAGPYILNDRIAERITAYLFHAGGYETPVALKANLGRSFEGYKVYGMGFTFDPDKQDGVTSSLETMDEVISRDRRNAQRIFPYMGGEEINDSPTHTPKRYVINFEEFPLQRLDVGATWQLANAAQRKLWVRQGLVPLDYPGPVAADWPDLLLIVEQRVKPERQLANRDRRRQLWWQYGEICPGLTEARKQWSELIAISRVSNTCAFVKISSTVVPSDRLTVFLFAGMAMFSVLQCRLHEIWARFFGSTLKDDLMYAPVDCFETFPFPSGWGSAPRLDVIGQEYYDFRASLMTRNNEGLTKTYNRFHDPNENSEEIRRLRELHHSMDRAVLDAYGWQDIQPNCEFIPEFDEEEDENETGRPKRKRYRFRWPDEIHDEVLALLLDLNRQRALEEGEMLAPPEPSDGPPPKRHRAAKEASKHDTTNGNHPLFATQEEKA